MNFTKNKIHRLLGSLLFLIGVVLMIVAFIYQHQRFGHFSPAAFGPMGILLVLAGIALLFSKPPHNERKP